MNESEELPCFDLLSLPLHSLPFPPSPTLLGGLALELSLEARPGGRRRQRLHQGGQDQEGKDLEAGFGLFLSSRKMGGVWVGGCEIRFGLLGGDRIRLLISVLLSHPG